MSHPAEIELQTGGSRWLHIAQVLAVLLGVAAILLSRSGAAWTSGSLVLLCLAYLSAALRLWLMNALGVVRLQPEHDGASLLTANGAVALRRRGGDWASRWCCVLRLEEVFTGRRFDCLICRSCNGSDAYRRLLVRLRMRDPRNRDNMHWT